MTIEERLIHDLGITPNFNHAVWLLPDGTLINGSHEGRQRDVDHHEIGFYFKKSKYDTGGDSYLYIKKFMNRGNIRWGCDKDNMTIEFTKKPTEKQIAQILKATQTRSQFAFRHNRQWYNLNWFYRYICRYCKRGKDPHDKPQTHRLCESNY